MSTIALETKPRVRVPARSALLTSAAMPMVQFRGIGAAGRQPAADDDDDMSEQDDQEIVGEDPKPKKKKSKAKKPAADDSTDDDGDDDQEDDDPDGDGDDDDNDDESDRREARGNTPVRAARLRERSRIAAILESPAAKANIDFAVKLALTTDLPRKQAIELLKSAPQAGGGNSLSDRMAQYANQRPGAGAVPAPKGQAAVDALWDSQAVANGIMPRRG